MTKLSKNDLTQAALIIEDQLHELSESWRGYSNPPTEVIATLERIAAWLREEAKRAQTQKAV